MKKLLFVCLGNICRSPAAQGITESLILANGLEDLVQVDSAGTANYQVGKPADPLMRAVAEARGYQVTSKAKQLTPFMTQRSDLVVAMDRDNFREILQISRGEPRHIRMLSDFLDPSWPRNVPDPYHGPEAGFHYVLDMLEKACPKILEELLGSQLPNRIADDPC